MNENNIEVGGYIQLGAFGVSVGMSGGEGLTIVPFTQASMGVAGLASAGISFNPLDRFSPDLNDHIIDYPTSIALGFGTPRLCCTNRLTAGLPLSPDRPIPVTFVTGMPSVVKPFRTATRIWNSAT